MVVRKAGDGAQFHSLSHTHTHILDLSTYLSIYLPTYLPTYLIKSSYFYLCTHLYIIYTNAYQVLILYLPSAYYLPTKSLLSTYQVGTYVYM
jgi:hypothetical protein